MWVDGLSLHGLGDNMNFLEKYKVTADKDYPFINKEWLKKSYGLEVGLEYACVGFSKSVGTLPPTIHLIVKDKIISALYDERIFHLVNEDAA
jgi:hypothetical protein